MGRLRGCGGNKRGRRRKGRPQKPEGLPRAQCAPAGRSYGGGQSFTTRLTSPKQVNPWLWLCWLLPSGHEPFQSRNDLICLVQRKRVTPRLRDCTPGRSSGEEPLGATGQFRGALTRLCSLVSPSYLLLCTVQSENACGSRTSQPLS